MIKGEFPEIPDSFVFEEVKENESQDDQELPTGFSRFQPKSWIESLQHSRQSSYLGHTLTVRIGLIRQDDRLRC